MVTFWDIALTFIGTALVFTVLYFLGSRKRERKKEALLPFVSGEEYHPMRIPYRVKWIYYVALFSAYETAVIFTILAILGGYYLVIPIIYILLLLISLILAPVE